MENKVHPSEGGTHWYDAKTGEPRYTIIGKNGKERNVTLRDAREHGYVPSVTGIIKCAAAPGLERWKLEQMLHAALTLPRRENEPESEYLDRIRADSQEQARKAAERGTAIHKAIQGHFEGIPPHQDYLKHVQAAVRVCNEWAGTIPITAEQSFAHPLGFGGKVDLWGDDFVFDFKSKEFTEDDKLNTWDEQAMQLSAYREGLELPEARCAIVYVSASVPGLARLIEIEEEKLKHGWIMFQNLLGYWRAKNGI